MAYVKFDSPPSGPRLARLFPDGHGLAIAARNDRSAHALLAANIVAAASALWLGMTIYELLIVYWVQNAAVGISHFIRILSLKRYTATAMMTDRRDVPVPLSKQAAAWVFLLTYGFFNALYLVWISYQPWAGHSSEILLGQWLCGAVFALNHAYSLAHNIQGDREAMPDLRGLMVAPYVRTVPMHLILFVGTVPGGGAVVVAVFLLLKTLADVASHVAEHHMLRTQ